MPTTTPFRVAAALLLAAALQTATADERFFTYSYEPKVLPQGAIELEQWATLRNGKEHVYARWDVRTEFEIGLTDRLTTALYMNWKNEWGFKNATTLAENKAAFTGWSSEWKYKLTDPTADSIGVLLYGEVGVDRHEWELEGKLVLGKNFGNVVTALNAIVELEGETEAELEEGEPESKMELEWVLENTAGIAYRLNSFALGLEGRTHTEIVEGETEHTAFFLGPVINVRSERWWATLTVLYQLTDILDEHERTETRLILGIHL
ncbi:MAG: hypothetical protein KatS3mg115_0569 [Candidatus Poribacteria bacterium]|nr:MAG: hypothetical protein KatS3mg115_0569 [Candidatus Poribacteria bacterium]